MATMRLKISDGTTTIDLFGGSDSMGQIGGLDMPPPRVRASFISNPLHDGARLASSKYDNRTITITLKIVGTTLSDLKDNIRSLQRVLNDARERVLLGQGTKYYLELQWGDTANQSTFFDILRGDLELPSDYMSSMFYKSFTVLDARLTLTCEPYGRYTNQTIGQDTIENSQSPYVLKDSFLVDDDGQHNVDVNSWEGQTFKTTSAYTAVGAAVKYFISNTVTDLTLELFDESGGEPTGSAIATGTVDTATLLPSATTNFGWIRVIFDDPVALDNATTYALVARIGETAPNVFQMRVDSTAGYGADGTRVWSANAGVGWNVDASDDFCFAIFAAETAANYQDITTTAAYGDVPAKMYHKIDLTGATGSKKVWVAKRSGSRQTNDLWIEAEELSSFTDIKGGAEETAGLLFPLTAASGGLYMEGTTIVNGGNISANTAIARANYTISTLPKGQFRVLIMARVIAEDPNDYDHISFGVGWGYGDASKTPTEAAGEYYQCAADSTWEVLDLGLLNIPPIAESDIASNNDLELRIFLYATNTLTSGEYYKWDVDWIFLLPIDEGVVIIDSVAAADILAIDSITDPPSVFIIDGSDNIEDYPDYVGSPLTIGREATRIYIIRDDVKAVTYASDITYQPQFMVV